MRQPYVVPRHRLVFAVWLTVLALPILVIDNIPRTEARAASVRADAPQVSVTTTSAPPTTAVDESTTVATDEAATADESTPVTAARKPVAKVAVKAPTSTSTSSTTTTTTAAPTSESGGASWYDYRAGECAHKTLPKGTVVTITSLENGARATCVVTDRGPYEAGRIIDLDRATFAQLKDPSLGVVQVEISW